MASVSCERIKRLSAEDFLPLLEFFMLQLFVFGEVMGAHHNLGTAVDFFLAVRVAALPNY
jgi:hypothetical protein